MSRSGDVYQCRVWLNEEKRYLRRSLKTTDHTTAVQRGEKIILETLTGVEAGKKFFGVNLGSLVEEYLEYRKNDIDVEGGITAGRFITIQSQCRALLRTKSPNLKMNELDENSFYDWRQMRQGDNPSIALVTIRNEQATINSIAQFAYRKKYIPFQRFNFRKISISKGQIGKRSNFTDAEYDRLIGFMRQYVSKKDCPNDDERIERLIVRDFILILSNTALRVGELRQMKWGDVESFTEETDESGQKLTLVTLNVRAEISKVRNQRRVISRGGEYFLRHKGRSAFTKADNLIFTNKSGTHQLGTRVLYQHWYRLMEGIGIDNYKERKLSYYSLRHFAITCRLRASVPIFDIASFAGTGVQHIENHYGHLTDEMRRQTALKNFTITKTGIVET
ncbi:MAG: site-specific integrase [Alphaproteobacteria bacterium]|nr:site-specific integrase [Alphaproteobacteria bacterium]